MAFAFALEKLDQLDLGNDFLLKLGQFWLMVALRFVTPVAAPKSRDIAPRSLNASGGQVSSIPAARFCQPPGRRPLPPART